MIRNTPPPETVRAMRAVREAKEAAQLTESSVAIRNQRLRDSGRYSIILLPRRGESATTTDTVSGKTSKQ